MFVYQSLWWLDLIHSACKCARVAAEPLDEVAAVPGRQTLMMNVLSRGMCSVVCFHPLATLPVFHLASNDSKAHLHAWIPNGPQEGSNFHIGRLVKYYQASVTAAAIRCVRVLFFFFHHSLAVLLWTCWSCSLFELTIADDDQRKTADFPSFFDLSCKINRSINKNVSSCVCRKGAR